MEDACIARILETRCYSKSGIPWPFVDRSIRREFFGGEIDDVFAARGGGFLRVTWLLSPSLSLSACALCHAWVVYAWFIVVSYDENIRERSSSKESDEFGSPLRDMGHARSIFIYIHFFLYFFCFYWKSWGEQREYRDTILSVITAILNMTLYREEYYISCVEYTALNKKRSFIEGK